MLACEIPSKKRCCYWEDEKTQQTIDEYNQLMSDTLRAALSLKNNMCLCLSKKMSSHRGCSFLLYCCFPTFNVANE